jgi:hypothetical protein
MSQFKIYVYMHWLNAMCNELAPIDALEMAVRELDK